MSDEELDWDEDFDFGGPGVPLSDLKSRTGESSAGQVVLSGVAANPDEEENWDDDFDLDVSVASVGKGALGRTPAKAAKVIDVSALNQVTQIVPASSDRSEKLFLALKKQAKQISRLKRPELVPTNDMVVLNSPKTPSRLRRSETGDLFRPNASNYPHSHKLPLGGSSFNLSSSSSSDLYKTPVKLHASSGAPGSVPLPSAPQSEHLASHPTMPHGAQTVRDLTSHVSLFNNRDSISENTEVEDERWKLEYAKLEIDFNDATSAGEMVAQANLSWKMALLCKSNGVAIKALAHLAAAKDFMDKLDPFLYEDLDFSSASLHYQLGVTSRIVQDIVQAQSFFKDAIKFSLSLNDRKTLMDSYLEMGYCLFKLDQWLQSLDYYNSYLSGVVETYLTEKIDSPDSILLQRPSQSASSGIHLPASDSVLSSSDTIAKTPPLNASGDLSALPSSSTSSKGSTIPSQLAKASFSSSSTDHSGHKKVASTPIPLSVPSPAPSTSTIPLTLEDFEAVSHVCYNVAYASQKLDQMALAAKFCRRALSFSKDTFMQLHLKASMLITSLNTSSTLSTSSARLAAHAKTSTSISTSIALPSSSNPSSTLETSPSGSSIFKSSKRASDSPWSSDIDSDLESSFGGSSTTGKPNIQNIKSVGGKLTGIGALGGSKPSGTPVSSSKTPSKLPSSRHSKSSTANSNATTDAVSGQQTGVGAKSTTAGSKGVVSSNSIGQLSTGTGGSMHGVGESGLGKGEGAKNVKLGLSGSTGDESVKGGSSKDDTLEESDDDWAMDDVEESDDDWAKDFADDASSAVGGSSGGPNSQNTSNPNLGMGVGANGASATTGGSSGSKLKMALLLTENLESNVDEVSKFKLLPDGGAVNIVKVIYPKPSILFSMKTTTGHNQLSETELDNWLQNLILKHRGDVLSWRESRIELDSFRNEFYKVKMPSLQPMTRPWCLEILSFSHQLCSQGYYEECWKLINLFFAHARQYLSSHKYLKGSRLTIANNLSFIACRIWTQDMDSEFNKLLANFAKLSSLYTITSNIMLAETLAHHSARKTTVLPLLTKAYEDAEKELLSLQAQEAILLQTNSGQSSDSTHSTSESKGEKASSGSLKEGKSSGKSDSKKSSVTSSKDEDDDSMSSKSGESRKLKALRRTILHCKTMQARVLADINFFFLDRSMLTTRHQKIEDDDEYGEDTYLCEDELRMKLMMKLYPEMECGWEKAKVALALGLSTKIAQDYEMAERLLFECVYMLEVMPSWVPGMRPIVSELGSTALTAYGEVLADNYKYKYSVPAIDGALLLCDMRGREEDYYALLRRAAKVAQSEGDLPRAIDLYTEICDHYRLDHRINEAVYVNELLCTMHIENGSFQQAINCLQRASECLPDYSRFFDETAPKNASFDPGFLRLQLQTAKTLLTSYHWDKAIDLLEQMSRYRQPVPLMLATYELLARAFLKKRSFSEADNWIDTWRDYQKAQSSLDARLLSRRYSVSNHNANMTYDIAYYAMKAKNCFFANKFSEALDFVDKAILFSSAKSLAALGKFYFLRGRILRRLCRLSYSIAFPTNLKPGTLATGLGTSFSSSSSGPNGPNGQNAHNGHSSSLNASGSVPTGTGGSSSGNYGKDSSSSLSHPHHHSSSPISPSQYHPSSPRTGGSSRNLNANLHPSSASGAASGGGSSSGGSSYSSDMLELPAHTFERPSDLLQECVATYRQSYNYFKLTGDDCKIAKALSDMAEAYLEFVFWPVSTGDTTFDDIATFPFFKLSFVAINAREEQRQNVINLDQRKEQQKSMQQQTSQSSQITNSGSNNTIGTNQSNSGTSTPVGGNQKDLSHKSDLASDSESSLTDTTSTATTGTATSASHPQTGPGSAKLPRTTPSLTGSSTTSSTTHPYTGDAVVASPTSGAHHSHHKRSQSAMTSSSAFSAPSTDHGTSSKNASPRGQSPHSGVPSTSGGIDSGSDASSSSSRPPVISSPKSKHRSDKMKKKASTSKVVVVAGSSNSGNSGSGAVGASAASSTQTSKALKESGSKKRDRAQSANDQAAQEAISSASQNQASVESEDSHVSSGNGAQGSGGSPTPVSGPSVVQNQTFSISLKTVENAAKLSLEIAAYTGNVLLAINGYMNMAEIRWLEGKTDAATQFFVESTEQLSHYFLNGTKFIMNEGPPSFLGRIFVLVKRIVRFLFFLPKQFINRNLYLVDTYLALEHDIEQQLKKAVGSQAFGTYIGSDASLPRSLFSLKLQKKYRSERTTSFSQLNAMKDLEKSSSSASASSSGTSGSNASAASSSFHLASGSSTLRTASSGASSASGGSATASSARPGHYASQTLGKGFNPSAASGSSTSLATASQPQLKYTLSDRRDSKAGMVGSGGNSKDSGVAPSNAASGTASQGQNASQGGGGGFSAAQANAAGQQTTGQHTMHLDEYGLSKSNAALIWGYYFYLRQQQKRYGEGKLTREELKVRYTKSLRYILRLATVARSQESEAIKELNKKLTTVLTRKSSRMLLQAPLQRRSIVPSNNQSSGQNSNGDATGKSERGRSDSSSASGPGATNSTNPHLPSTGGTTLSSSFNTSVTSSLGVASTTSMTPQKNMPSFEEIVSNRNEKLAKLVYILQLDDRLVQYVPSTGRRCVQLIGKREPLGSSIAVGKIPNHLFLKIHLLEAKEEFVTVAVPSDFTLYDVIGYLMQRERWEDEVNPAANEFLQKELNSASQPSTTSSSKNTKGGNFFTSLLSGLGGIGSSSSSSQGSISFPSDKIDKIAQSTDFFEELAHLLSLLGEGDEEARSGSAPKSNLPQSPSQPLIGSSLSTIPESSGSASPRPGSGTMTKQRSGSISHEKQSSSSASPANSATLTRGGRASSVAGERPPSLKTIAESKSKAETDDEEGSTSSDFFADMEIGMGSGSGKLGGVGGVGDAKNSKQSSLGAVAPSSPATSKTPSKLPSLNLTSPSSQGQSAQQTGATPRSPNSTLLSGMVSHRSGNQTARAPSVPSTLLTLAKRREGTGGDPSSEQQQQRVGGSAVGNLIPLRSKLHKKVFESFTSSELTKNSMVRPLSVYVFTSTAKVARSSAFHGSFANAIHFSDELSGFLYSLAGTPTTLSSSSSSSSSGSGSGIGGMSTVPLNPSSASSQTSSSSSSSSMNSTLNTSTTGGGAGGSSNPLNASSSTIQNSSKFAENSQNSQNQQQQGQQNQSSSSSASSAKSSPLEPVVIELTQLFAPLIEILPLGRRPYGYYNMLSFDAKTYWKAFLGEMEDRSKIGLRTLDAMDVGSGGVVTRCPLSIICSKYMHVIPWELFLPTESILRYFALEDAAGRPTKIPVKHSSSSGSSSRRVKKKVQFSLIQLFYSQSFRSVSQQEAVRKQWIVQNVSNSLNLTNDRFAADYSGDNAPIFPFHCPTVSNPKRITHYRSKYKHITFVDLWSYIIHTSGHDSILKMTDALDAPILLLSYADLLEMSSALLTLARSKRSPTFVFIPESHMKNVISKIGKRLNIALKTEDANSEDAYQFLMTLVISVSNELKVPIVVFNPPSL
jgi:tetratricopeptide (TPR) repeat protein